MPEVVIGHSITVQLPHGFRLIKAGEYILSIDAGTTNCKAVIFDRSGEITGKSSKENSGRNACKEFCQCREFRFRL